MFYATNFKGEKNSPVTIYTAQKVKLSITDFLSKCDQIRKKL